MSRFGDAIAWRGGGRLSFIIYGLWGRDEVTSRLADVTEDLTRAAPESRVSAFVAADDDWPFDVGVFDVEGSTWPDDPELFCNALLATICRHGARVSWMMFDGVFNDVWDILSDGWAPHVYALRHCRIDRIGLALADDVRQSPEWTEFVRGFRGLLIAEYPSLKRA